MKYGGLRMVPTSTRSDGSEPTAAAAAATAAYEVSVKAALLRAKISRKFSFLI